MAKLLRDGLPPLPPRMAKLHVDARGYPVPYFVEWINGEPDFRVMNAEKWVKCVKHGLCWVCGDPVGRFKTFVIGPMCVLNRTTAEPPCHLDCAVFSATACPFLTLPKSKRNDANMPAHRDMPGIPELRNPGVTCLWTVFQYRIVRVKGGDGGGNAGNLIQLPDPVSVHWYTQKRKATREEVLASIDSGLPRLRELADQDRDPKGAHDDLVREYERMKRWLPAEPT